MLKDMEFDQKPERNFHRKNNPSPENENTKKNCKLNILNWN